LAAKAWSPRGKAGSTAARENGQGEIQPDPRAWISRLAQIVNGNARNDYGGFVIANRFQTRQAPPGSTLPQQRLVALPKCQHEIFGLCRSGSFTVSSTKTSVALVRLCAALRFFRACPVAYAISIRPPRFRPRHRQVLEYVPSRARKPLSRARPLSRKIHKNQWDQSDSPSPGPLPDSAIHSFHGFLSHGRSLTRGRSAL